MLITVLQLLIANHCKNSIQALFRSISTFLDLIHEKYPEINLEVIPYSSSNYTEYVQAQLDSGGLPDIYFTTTYTMGRDDVSDRLLNLAGYAFTDN